MTLITNEDLMHALKTFSDSNESWHGAINNNLHHIEDRLERLEAKLEKINNPDTDKNV